MSSTKSKRRLTMKQRETEERVAEKKGSGEFFSTDQRTWTALCLLGNVRMAISYLVIAQGTLKGGRFSSWSAKSIEAFVGIHHERAKQYIRTLIDHGFLELDTSQHSTKRRPRYIVRSYAEVCAQTSRTAPSTADLRRAACPAAGCRCRTVWVCNQRAKVKASTLTRLQTLGLVRFEETNSRAIVAYPSPPKVPEAIAPWTTLTTFSRKRLRSTSTASCRKL